MHPVVIIMLVVVEMIFSEGATCQQLPVKDLPMYVTYLQGKTIDTMVVNGVEKEIWLKEPGDSKPALKTTKHSGTGLFIVKLWIYLIMMFLGLYMVLIAMKMLRYTV